MKGKLLFIDTETGGLNSNIHSLLSIGLVTWNDGRIVNQKEIYIKSPVYNVTEEAMNINKIDLKNLDKIGMNKREAKDLMIKFLKDEFKNEKITLAGHNVNFDISFLKQLFKNDFSLYFSHRSIDTASIFKYLTIKGILKTEVVSLDDAINYFQIRVKNRHTALDDVLATAKIFTKLIELKED
jgi:DNA polymerase III epsilon subunit-like protein